MKDRSWILILIALGGAAFWAPDVLYHVRTDELSKQDISVLTFLLPTSLLICYTTVLLLKGRRGGGPSIALYMLLGIWLLGPLSMMISATFDGAGFHTGEASWISLALGVVPIYTFIMAAYDGSVLALLIVSCVMVSAHLMYELNHHWVIPPSIKRLKHRLERR